MSSSSTVPPSTSEDLPDIRAIEVVDQEVDKHRAEIIRLYRQRNTLIPIARLPPEVLGNVFMFCVFAGRISDFSFGIMNPRSSDWWINVTYVCHRWREVALSTPRIWSYLSEMSPKLLQMFISRSKSAPLFWRMNCYQQSASLLEGFSSYPNSLIGRIQELRINADSDTLYNILDKLSISQTASDEPVPIISLQLRATYPQTLDRKIPPSFSGRRFPYLKELDLSCCGVDWTSPLFSSPQLTHLTISGSTLDPLPFPQLLAILEAQPNITHLVLDLDSISGWDGVSGMTLASAQSIELRGSTIECLNLWKRTSYPKTLAHLSLDLRRVLRTGLELDEIETSELECRVLSCLEQQYNPKGDSELGGPPRVIQYLSISASGGSYNLQCSTTPWKEDVRDADSSLSLFLNLDLSSMSNRCPITPRALPYLPLQNLTKLRFYSIFLSHRDWSKLFERATIIEEISYGGFDHAPAFVKALLAAKEMDPESNLTTAAQADTTLGIPLPQLRRLELCYLDFGSDGEMQNDLTTCLERRRSEGIGLESLTLRQCRKLDHERLNSLISANIVTTIDWDRFKDVESSDDSDAPYMYNFPFHAEDFGDGFDDGYSEEMGYDFDYDYDGSFFVCE